MATKKKPKKKPTPAAKKPAQKAAKSAKKTAKKSASKKSASKKTASKKTASKKTASKKTASKKTASKKTASKKTAKKTASQKKAAKSSTSSSKSGTATIVQHVFFAARPADVYRALTDPTTHGAVTGTVATGEPIEGGTFTASSGYIHGTFEKLEENKLIVQTWSTTEWPAGALPSRLEISLEDGGDGTELTMTHSELPMSQAESYRQGWIDFYWTPMRAHFGKA